MMILGIFTIFLFFFYFLEDKMSIHIASNG